MNPLTLLQTALIEGCPTGADIAAGRASVPPHITEVMVLIPPTPGESWSAAGPFPVSAVEWPRLRPGYRVYWPKD